ncbi:VWA domain-containing protein [Stenotrophomonas maltophilia]|uniref:VWA domain-containing protein n=1 Tax=Stenotrophomonas TaxID=40323 RepID=UPI0006C156C8|nr:MULTISPECIES: VWA domain-containing protein [Stenotrophomonas]KAA3596937.1 VWA domain-containing protein [Stenotrophomonas maltophilia]KOO80089.1 membrane protein [Stenotrophomonas maltophilia]MBN5127061.1 VWA domain-containing protein [Stenotrophomonas maltophilia]MBN5176545.1 VWA domain-containing protein [Stenotrophomonas maltophilia]MCU1124468.1 VWA domain-containing protein [Stenotrophomonas maltophilia]
MIAFASNLPDWNALHFLRPEWLWALLALPLILALALYRQRRSDAWRQAVDAHLLPHLLAAGAKRRVRLPWALLLGWTLASLAMAGPSWRQQAQPMFQASAPLLVVLDLSSRISATDLPPSRLLQVRAKLGELLRARQGGQVGLVVYADDAYTVAPLTDDGSNVALYLDALSPDVMPRDGQRADRGIDWATRLMRQIGALQGQILLVSDQADSEAALAAAQARSLGLQVSVLGLGTPAGAAYRDGSGQIRQAALDEGSLRAVATAGGGRYARIAADDSDLRALGVLDARDGTAAQRPGEGKQWRDEGFWLLPPVMLLALLAFRRRAVLAAVLAVGLLPWMNGAQARAPATPVSQPAQGTLWKRSDQLQHQRLAEGVQAYRKGDFATARKQFEGIDSDAGWYNLANTLAREGNYDEAIAAYDRALALHPGMADAVANRAVVDAARKRRQSGGGQGQDQQTPPQKQQDRSQGKQNPQGQQPQQGQKDPGQGQPQPGQQGQPGQESDKAQSSPQPGQRSREGQQAPPQVEDARAQAQADEQQRQRMQQAMQQAREGEVGKDGKPVPGSEGRTPRQREEQQAVEAWMRRVPDDPGALLRAKFQLENERRKREGR